MRRLLQYIVQTIPVPAAVIMMGASSAAQAQVHASQSSQTSSSQSAFAGQGYDGWDGRWNAAAGQPPAVSQPIPAIPVPQGNGGPQGIPQIPVPLPPQMGILPPTQSYTTQSYATQSYTMGGGAFFSVAILSVPVVTTTTTEYVEQTAARSARRSWRHTPRRRACSCRVVCQ